MATPRPDIKMIKKTRDLRRKGLSIRQIGKLLDDRDAKQIHRWLNYPVDNLFIKGVDSSK